MVMADNQMDNEQEMNGVEHEHEHHHNQERLTQSGTTSRSQAQSQSRSSFNFTEAVPLALSSLAHLAVPLEEGVVDGIRDLVQHTQLACINYARATSANEHSLRELWVDDWRWTKSAATDLPPALQKLGTRHRYCQQVRLCLGPQPNDDDLTEKENWLDCPSVLGTITFVYASEELFTQDQLNAENDDDSEIPPDDDEMPNCVLYKVLVEHRSLPPTSNKVAVEAEELGMLSFGGSVDDAVKYGALASLHDDNAKYVMEIYSVRGKKYKFDLMDSTLSDGRLPRWKAKEGSEPPFVKSLCVTVTEHNYQDNISRLSLILDGNLRKPMEYHPKLHFYAKKLEQSFLIFQKPVSIMALPSRQSIMLDSDLAGQIFVDGRYITAWGNDSKIGTHVEALFGLDLHSIPVWHGRIVDYDMMKHVYSLMWQEVMVDSRLMGLQLAKMLLYRLMYGKDEAEVYDDEEDMVDTSQDTLESQIMSSTKYDPVGICAKALATCFSLEFGKDAFPSLAQDVHAVQQHLGHRTPIIVPSRLISVLRRGGYFDLASTVAELWFNESARSPNVGSEMQLVIDAVNLLSDAGLDGVSPNHVLFIKIADPNPVKHYNLCRYQAEHNYFFLNECMASSTPIWVALAIARQHPEGGTAEQKFLEKYLIPKV